jgi:hypothetical protein
VFTVIAKLKNHSDLINGIKFTVTDGVRSASGLSQKDASMFLKVPGFDVVPDKKAAAAVKAVAEAKAAAEKPAADSAEAAAAELIQSIDKDAPPAEPPAKK